MTGTIYTMVPAAWDVESFLENAKSKLEEWGGLGIMLIGTAVLVWFAVKLAMKIMASPQNQQQQTSWGMLAVGLVVGGALSLGGWSLISEVGSGGQQTVEDLGTGTITAQVIDWR